jgi:hypothetical protein
MGPDVSEPIVWVEADLASWTPQRDEYDLVICLYAVTSRRWKVNARTRTADAPFRWLGRLS